MLLIANGHVLAPGEPRPSRADVLVDGERIIAVGPHLAAPADSEPLDATGKLILPGLINAHTHAHNNLIKGVIDNVTLELFLNAGPAMYLNRTPEEQYLSALLGAVEMVKTGATAAYDLFMQPPSVTIESIEAVARAYADAGIRAVVAPAVADLLFFDWIPGLLEALPEALRNDVERRRPPQAADILKTVRDGLLRYHDVAGGRVRLAVAPTIPGQCTDDFLIGSQRLAEEFGAGLHTHLAETKIQALSGLRRHGRSLTRHLHDLGLLGPRFTGAHAIWLDHDDIGLMAETGSSAVHNPASNMKTGAGIAPVVAMRSRGVNVALGTDGSGASDNQNMFESLRFAALLSKVRSPDYPEWLTAPQVFDMATTGSARALGFGDRLGCIAPGYLADLVLLRLDSIYLSPLNDVMNQLVYCETGSGVDTVLVGGRLVVQGGRVMTVDEASLHARVQAAADRIRAQNRQEWELTHRLAPIVGSICRALAREPHPIQRYGATDWMTAPTA
jgi:5-methylthioadenosine/S-adenosylhomocysteine deaminase